MDYSPGAVHEAIRLYHGLAKLSYPNGESIAGQIEIDFQWLPTLGARFNFEAPRPILELGEVEILGVPGVERLHAHITGADFGRGTSLSGFVSKDAGPAVCVNEVNFGITNFRPFVGEWIDEDYVDETGEARRSRRAARLNLSWSGWNLTIDERRNSSEIIAEVKKSGGVAVTHIASLTAIDGTAFSTVEAEEMLWAVHVFLSLIRGTRSTPVLIAGRNMEGELIWHNWVPQTSERWYPATGAFDEHHTDEYRAAFPGFMDRWFDDLWNEPLRRAVHMYLDANSGMTLDTSILMCQTILELISWVRFVEEEESRTESDFDKERASTRIRDLLAWMELDPQIPANLTSLTGLAKTANWEDGPRVLTEVRNGMIHPRKRKRIGHQRISALIELHELSLWYVELALLRLIGLDGKYRNRLGTRNRGDVEPLPWTSRE